MSTLYYCIFFVLRRSDGRKYNDQTADVKKAKFPYPSAAKPSGQGKDQPAVVRTPSSYSQEINDLQAKLHAANEQLELSNSECVTVTTENQQLRTQLVEARATVRSLGADNSALEKRVASLEEGEVNPRPGPRLKPFDQLTPRQQKKASNKLQSQVVKTAQERRILPGQLSAFLSYR